MLQMFFQHPGATAFHLVEYDRFLNRREQPLQVFRSTDLPFLAATPNRSLAIFGSRHDWCGTIVILKFADRYCLNYVDISITDLDDIRSHFVYFA